MELNYAGLFIIKTENYSQTFLFWTPWDPKNCPYYKGAHISEVHYYIYIAMGPRLSVLIIEVSLFQSVHNSRFDCTCNAIYEEMLL